MSRAKQVTEHYFQVHGLQVQAPEGLNDALKDAIKQLRSNLYGPSRTELTPTEVATSLSPAEVAKRLNITPARVRQLIREHALFAIRIDGRWHVPVFQFDGDALVPNISRVNARVATLNAVSVMRWYTTEDPELEDSNGRILTPLEWLKTGHHAETLIAITPES
jgi:hypothetical protein